MKKIVLLSLPLYLILAEELVLDEIVVTDKKEFNTKLSEYGTSRTMSREKLDTITSKDATITEVLKVNPSVSFSKNARTATEAGEISPKDITINGASFYQNNFMVDGLNFNDDINPDGYKTLFKNTWKGPSLGSQAINLSADLLDSIEVIDSSVSAKYGGFQGGVVNAKTRDPRPGFHGIASFGYTSGDWTKTFIDPLVENNYLDSTGWYDKSDFTKRKYRFGMEGYASEDFGILFDYTKHKSKIKTHTKPSILDPNIAKFPDETRDAQNYFLKGVWHAGDNWVVKPSILYSKQTSRSFIEHDINSGMDNEFGGYALNLEIDGELDGLFLEQKLSYSEFESSRYFDFKDGLYSYVKSNIKNWGNSWNAREGNYYSYYGGLGDIEQLQKTFNYKIDAKFEEIEALGLKHNFIAGFEYENKKGSYKTLTPFAQYYKPKPLPDGYICDLGDLTCINDSSFGGAGQYLSELYYYGGVNNKASMDKIAIYLEDDIRYGKLKIRPGVRVERNSINGDTNIAPRFATEYEFYDENFFGFGLNRYYGRDLFAQKIYNNMYVHQQDFSRDHPSKNFTQTSNWLDGFLGNKIKTPYDDEFSIFYRGDIDNARLNLKYVKRKSKDEIVTRSRINADLLAINTLENNYKFYTNEGKTNSDIYTFGIQNIEPLVFLDTLNNFELSFSYMDRKRNFNTYTDINLYDRNVIYNGKEIAYADLPVVDFYTPYGIKLSHSMQVPTLNLTISNFINYVGGNEALIRGYDAAKEMTSYEKIDLPSHTTWDMRISYKQPIKGDMEFFANLDINNILNKKYAVDASTSNNERYYIFDSGRSFWLEAGLKW